MHAVARHHPLQIAATPPLPPPLLPEPKTSDTPMPYPSWTYVRSRPGHSMLKIDAFVQDLRLLHRRTLILPTPSPASDLWVILLLTNYIIDGTHLQKAFCIYERRINATFCRFIESSLL